MSPVTEFGWLIEHPYTNPPRWLRIVPRDTFSDHPTATLDWTEIAEAALRFARKQDAEQFAYLHPERCVLARATEQGFLLAEAPQRTQRGWTPRRGWEVTGDAHL